MTHSSMRHQPQETGGDRTTMPIFETVDLSVGFGDRDDVLRHVNVQVKRGEFVALLGRSGCGKSTLLNIAAGLLAPRSGSATFDGKPIKGINTRVGYMTQDDTLLPWKTVESNVGLPLHIRGWKRSEIAQRVSYYLELLDLEDAAGYLPGQLSGGMRRRALLARSMIYEPQLLIMDEPFAALDAQMRHEMHRELHATVHKLDQTVMFVTHDITEAAKLADRVLVVGGGPPGTIAEEINVDLGFDRDLDALRFTDEFAAVELQLNQALINARSHEGGNHD